MKSLNLKGVTTESVVGVLVLVLALVNAIFDMFGMKVLPITNDDIYTVVSGVVLVGSALYNTYKNFNTSTASQTAQQITDAIKNGEILAEDVEDVIAKLKTAK